MKKFIITLVISVLALNHSPSLAQNTNKTCDSSLTSTNSSIKLKSIDNFVGNFDNKINIVFSDIDGTIARFDKNVKKPNLSPKSILAVKKLNKTKVPIVLTTGRVYIEAKEIAKVLGNKNAYIITNQGAEIRNPQGKLIYQDNINYEDTKNIINLTETIIKSNNLKSKTVLFLNGKLYSTQKFELPYIWAPVTVVKSYSDLGKSYTPCEIMIYDTNPVDLRLIQSNLKNNFPKYNINLSTHCFCDITSTTANKGNAVKKLAGILNIDLKNAATIGDAENDITMIKLIRESGGASIVVGNAMENLKANAEFITSTVDEDGFAKAIDKILENNALLK